MTSFKVSQLTQSSLLYLYSTKEEIEISPDYQRMGEVWTTDKRQLLIDSILNGFDIPKLYFHEFSEKKKNSHLKYAIIDGRQRLESIWSFIDGAFALSKDFEFINDTSVKAAGLTYRELSEMYPKIKTRFDSTSLTVVVIQTEDTDLIEEMFSRLNEAVPLNAAEKRNALGGPVPKAIRKIADHAFFKSAIRISNRRYQHRDLAAKILYLASRDKISDTKKIYLDDFVRRLRTKPLRSLRPAMRRVEEVLSRMERTFVRKDKLLRSSGVFVIYFLLFRDGLDEGWVDNIRRTALEKFEVKREQNRSIAEKDLTKANYDYLEYDRYSQSPNDAYAIRLRLDILKKFLKIDD